MIGFSKMNTRLVALTAAALLALAVTSRANDPSDLFLQAYQEYQAGEKFERDGRLRDALNSYTSTVSILDKVRNADPSWQQMVVDYRLRKAQENIERLRSTVSSMADVSDPAEDPLPTRGFEIDIPEPSVATRPPGATTAGSAPAARPFASGQESSTLRRQLEDSRSQIARLEEELTRARGQASGAKMALEKTKAELVATTSRLTQSEVALENVVSERDQLKARAAEPEDKRLAKLSGRIAELEADSEVLQDENARLLGKLENADSYIKASKKILAQTEKDRLALAGERDQALARTKRLKENDAEIARLTAERTQIEKDFAKEKNELAKQLAATKSDLDRLAAMEAENKDLSAKLSKTEAALAAATKDGITPEALAALQEEVALLQDRLAASRQKLLAREENTKALLAQLDDATGEVARLRLNPEPGEEQKRIAAENELLKNIVLRQLKEQGERTQAVAALEQELEKLYVKSDNLSAQLAVLTRPQQKLSDQELHMFRDPFVVLQNPESGGPEVAMSVIKQSDGVDPAPLPGGAEDLSNQARELVVQATNLVKERRFTDAEKLYFKIVDEAPNNYFALSNLAVTQIQAGKLSAAQVALEKALSLKPGDIFASVNLAIVYSRQNRYEDAIEILKEVIKSDAQNAVAHNYMAIALGKKGNVAEAEEFFQRSIMLDGKYSNAHFNLAVMYVSTDPPSLELAKKHYETAKALGAEPDPALERRLANINAPN